MTLWLFREMIPVLRRHMLMYLWVKWNDVCDFLSIVSEKNYTHTRICREKERESTCENILTISESREGYTSNRYTIV